MAVRASEHGDGGLPKPTACDLIMKGGITSGVVYPAAVSELKDHFRFCSIGGASAGAIAAAATAAAQLGRDRGGFDRLKELARKLEQDGFLLNLFQPSPKTAFLFGLLADLQRHKGLRGKLGHAVGHLVWRFLVACVLGALAGLLVLWLLITSFCGGDDRQWWGWVLLALLVMLGATLGLLIALIFGSVRVVTRHLPENYFGICTGMPQPGRTEQALTPWLHDEIQACAGKPPDQPLTFGDLKSAEVTLQMMTTDLTYARPVRLPIADDPAYLFSLKEFAVLFPKPVLDHLERITELVHPAGTTHGRSDSDRLPELRRLPGLDLPVIVATRMSLSFPGLLSAVPLWTDDGEGPMRHWLSDGGIGSNFPIHFFDAWLPTRPTFGLNLVPEQAEWVRTQALGGPPPRRRTPVRTTVGFARQILDTMQNWRDTMQAELPGFRDRIRAIELGPGEGGMNLGMDPETIRRLAEKGHAKGRELAEDFVWDEHLFWRYVYLMRLLQENLNGSKPADGAKGRPGVADAFQAFQEMLLAGMPSVGGDRHEYDRAWCAAAAQATRRLLNVTATWGKAAAPSASTPASATEPPADFLVGAPPTPEHIMRVTPNL
jgi:predicted acylesterase/phospholipase RssA